MGRKVTEKLNGCPQLIFDWERIDNLIHAGFNGVQVAKAIGCHPNTLYQRYVAEQGMSFCEYFRLKKAKGDAPIRIAQFEEAVYQRNVPLLIWLGKQRLVQTNKSQITDKNEYAILVVSYSGKPIEPWSNA